MTTLTWQLFDEQLHEISKLKEDWDGYGAADIDHRTVANVKKIQQELRDKSIVPDLSPTPTGTITLEWDDDVNHSTLEVGVNNWSMYVAPNDRTPTQVWAVYLDGNFTSEDNDKFIELIETIIEYFGIE